MLQQHLSLSLSLSLPPSFSLSEDRSSSTSTALKKFLTLRGSLYSLKGAEGGAGERKCCDKAYASFKDALKVSKRRQEEEEEEEEPAAATREARSSCVLRKDKDAKVRLVFS
jgi:hypothetical protein